MTTIKINGVSYNEERLRSFTSLEDLVNSELGAHGEKQCKAVWAVIWADDADMMPCVAKFEPDVVIAVPSYVEGGNFDGDMELLKPLNLPFDHGNDNTVSEPVKQNGKRNKRNNNRNDKEPGAGLS